MKQFALDPLYPSLRTQRDVTTITSILITLHAKTQEAEKLLPEKLPYETAQAILAIAQEAEVDFGKQTEAEEFLQKLEEALNKIPILTLNLAKDPSEKLLDTIRDWWKTNVKTPLLLTIKTDPSLIGGAQLFFNGKYKDYSVRKQLENT